MFSPPPARRLVLVALLFAGTLGCDQATKRLAVEHLPEGRRTSYAGDTLRLERVRNAGAFLSLGASLPEGVRTGLFTWGAAAIVGFALWLSLRPDLSSGAASAAALIAAGGAGNLWDRLQTGGWVVDFLNLGIGPVRTGIFNVADVALMAGAGLMLLAGRGPRTRAAPRT